MMSSSTVLRDIVNNLKLPYKSANYGSNQRSTKFGNFHESHAFIPRRHFSSLLVNFGQNNSLFRPILRACRSGDSFIYLRHVQTL